MSRTAAAVSAASGNYKSVTERLREQFEADHPHQSVFEVRSSELAEQFRVSTAAVYEGLRSLERRGVILKIRDAMLGRGAQYEWGRVSGLPRKLRAIDATETVPARTEAPAQIEVDDAGQSDGELIDQEPIAFLEHQPPSQGETPAPRKSPPNSELAAKDQTEDCELAAIATCFSALSAVSSAARKRAFSYLIARFEMQPEGFL